jgi:cytoskeletal protein RodZ
MTKQPRKPKLIRWSLLPVVLGSAFALPVHSQSSAASSIPSKSKPQVGKDASQSSHLSPPDPTTEASPHASSEELRQAQIEADTKKLYQLSADLRAEVAKTYKESLSIAVLKKAEEVEKLAKSLKVRMSQDAAETRHQDR